MKLTLISESHPNHSNSLGIMKNKGKIPLRKRRMFREIRMTHSLNNRLIELKKFF
jgi:hypothetical protein